MPLVPAFLVRSRRATTQGAHNLELFRASRTCANCPAVSKLGWWPELQPPSLFVATAWGPSAPAPEPLRAAATRQGYPPGTSARRSSCGRCGPRRWREAHRLAGRRDAHELAHMGAARRHAPHHFVAFGDQVFDLNLQIGKAVCNSVKTCLTSSRPEGMPGGRAWSTSSGAMISSTRSSRF